MGLLAGALFTNVRVAMGVLPLVFLPFMLFGGFYSNRNSFGDWIGWIQYLSPFKYGF